MKKRSEYIQIARCLAHRFAGISTPEEEKRIKDWKAASKDNRALYDNLCERLIEGEEVDKYDAIDTSAAYQRFLVGKYSKQKQFRGRRLLRYSLKYAAILVFLLGGAYYFYSKQSQFQPEAALSGLASLRPDEEIKPGKPEAILTLSDGQQIALNQIQQEKLDSLNGVDISMGSGKLKYNKTSAPVTTVPDYNTIEIPRGGEYYLELSDGSRLWLNSDTRLRYPTAFYGKDRRIYLERGEIFLEVTKDREHPFYVECAKSSVRVLGTSFNLLFYKDQPTQATLVEGSVEITHSGNKMLLAPGEQANMAVDGMLTKKKVDVLLYTSWKDGRYYFKSEKLGVILDKIARWYNISVIYSRQELKEEMFSGSFLKYNDFKEVLEILNTTQTVKFKILDNRTIEVSE